VRLVESAAGGECSGECVAGGECSRACSRRRVWLAESVVESVAESVECSAECGRRTVRPVQLAESAAGGEARVW
jgi:hypothetical protein